MKQQIERLRGGVAFGMAGYGPKPVMSPPDETGNDGGQQGDGNEGGDNSGNQGGDSGIGDGGDKGNGGRAPKLGGLFSQRTQQQQQAADDGNDDDGGDDGKPGADGRPAGLAEKFWNAKDKSINVDALTKAYTDLEKSHGELKRSKGSIGGEVPKDASEYFAEGIKIPENADRFSSLGADDPGVKAFADVCKARGIGKDIAAGILSDMLVAMNEHAPVPIDPVQEMKSLGKGGPALVDGLYVWCEGLEQAGELSGDDLDVIETMVSTAKGVRTLAKLRNMTGEQPIPVDPGGGVQGMSLDQLEAKYRQAVKDNDYAEQERLDGLRARVNPEGQAPGISSRPGGYSI